jgi:nitroreductase
VDFFETVTTTRAIRRYADEPIPDADLATMLFAATRAPTGSNRQPFRFLVLRDGPRATKARALLGESFRGMWSGKASEDGYGEGTGADPSSPKARMAATMQHFVDHIEEAPVIVLGCLVRWRSPDPTEGASIYPACQNLLLSARALGYGGVMTMWHKVVQDELIEVLGVPDGVDLAACIPLGRPVGHHGPVRRRPMAEVVFEDGWGEVAPWAVDPEGTRFAGPKPSRRTR